MLRRAYAFYEHYVISRGEAMFEKGVKILEETMILKCLNINCRFWLIKTVLFTGTFALTLNFQIKVVSTFFIVDHPFPNLITRIHFPFTCQDILNCVLRHCSLNFQKRLAFPVKFLHELYQGFPCISFERMNTTF